MRPWLQALLLLWLAPNAFAKAPAKLVVVVSDGWRATAGKLRRFQRDPGGWRAVGDLVPVVLGSGGLAWPEDKREGDRRSPAGRLELGDVTGYDDAPPGLTLGYRRASASLRCVDDPRSPAYNTLAERADGGAAWSSDEPLRRDDELYRLTLFVRHNPARIPGHGSCIFLHVWRDADSPTVGCTAMALPALRALVLWADATTELVQLPRAEYRRLQRAWDLPPLALVDGQRK